MEQHSHKVSPMKNSANIVAANDNRTAKDWPPASVHNVVGELAAPADLLVGARSKEPIPSRTSSLTSLQMFCRVSGV
jgi:hypothetical protein